jgi:hypothetical protein
MAFISFALTENEFLSGIKTVTRRDWKDSHFQKWVKWWHEGKRIHQAWNKVPFAGGHQIGWFELICEPYRERLADMPESDLAAEGGMCATKDEYFQLIGKTEADIVTVIRFKLLKEV